jgi:hypothetical protein
MHLNNLTTKAMSKKLVLSFVFLLMLSTAFSQSYTADLVKINEFLKILDNGFYGKLEIKNGMLYNFTVTADTLK